MIDKVIVDPDDFFPPDITPKKCRECAHAYYMYGIEFNCDRENNGKRCRFKRKTKEMTCLKKTTPKNFLVSSTGSAC